MPPIRRPRRPLIWLMLLVGCGMLLGAWLAGLQAERRYLQERAMETRGQLELYAQALQNLIERVSSVPALLAQDSEIRQLLEQPLDAQRQAQINRRLERLNRSAGASVLYLTDHRGQTLASSNWQEPTSFVGHNYAFRPYFQQAMQQGTGRYFAVGVTTGIPGYFLSHVIHDPQGKPNGVLVIKLELEELQREWVNQPGVLLVADNHEIVIISNRPGWRFRYLQELPQPDWQALLEARKYAEQQLKPLPYRLRRELGEYGELRQIDGPEGPQDYIWQHQPLPQDGWNLYLLSERAEPDGLLNAYRLGAAGLWLTLVFLLLYLAQRRKNRRLQRRNQLRLEREVELRTQELRQAQNELVQAGKLAALGQMSAALAHEINQPLTAMQMQLGSLRLLLAHDDPQAVQQGIARLESLVQRMAALTGHLKTFARKRPDGLRERLDLRRVIDQSLHLLDPRLKREQVELHIEGASQAWVEGDPIRLEQVMLNLLHNALDAMHEQPGKRLWINLERQGTNWQLSVTDNGGGIADEHLQRLFDPFFTTKPVGAGLGLGLSISYGIVHALGGTLEADNTAQGARFTLRLPTLD